MIPFRRKAWWIGGSVAIVLLLGGIFMTRLAPKPATVEIPLPTRSTAFDGNQAMRYLEAICKLGPRMTATPEMNAQQQILVRHFEALGAVVELQSFEGTQPSRRRPFPCANLVVRWHPERDRRVLLGAHYDTRPIADQEPVPRNRAQPILGANDGASGVAFLMELGRLIPELDLKVGVDFVFFDAEEFIHDPLADRFFLGSEHFVSEYLKNRPKYRYEAVIVLDMIGDKDLAIHPDGYSVERAGPLVEEVWTIARHMRLPVFRDDVRFEVRDDHIAFLDAKIPAIVLIDFDYPHWHRLTDTPDKCSPDSLAAVSQVIIEWLKRRR